MSFETRFKVCSSRLHTYIGRLSVFIEVLFLTKKIKNKCLVNEPSRAAIISNTRKFDNVTPILEDLSWLPDKSQLYHRNAVLAFKCMSGLTPPSLASLYLKRGEVSGRVTRNSHLLNIPCFKSATEQRTFHIGQFRRGMI